MPRVLIVDYHFPPINNINARRFGGMVKYMPKFGWEPIVLTTKTQGELPVLMPEENIIRIGENYDSKKKLVVAEEGYKGIPWLLKIPYFFYRNLKMEIVSVDRFIFSWGREVKNAGKLIKEKNPDLIIGSCYPPVSVWAARYFSDFLKKPWIPDFQDPFSLWNNAKFPFVRLIDKIIDKKLVSSAVGVVTISSHLAEEMKKLYKKPVEVVYNGFDRIQESFPQKTADKKIVYYAGRFHDHRMPAVKLFLEWMERTKRKDIYFILRSLGPVRSNEEIMAYAKENNLADKISILPPASPEVIFKEEEEADALIIFEDLNKKMSHSEGTLSGKLMEHIPFRAPIIAINRVDSEMGRVLKETGRGYLVSDINQLDKVMKEIFKGNGFEFNWERVNKFSREEQTKKLCQFLDLCLKK